MTDTTVDKTTDERTAVEFWFDPNCPWAWMTSRWVGEVAQHRDLDVTWKVMSLFVLNEDQDVPADYKERLHAGQVYPRIVTAARLRLGQDIVTARVGESLYMPAGVHGTFDIREDVEAFCVHYPTDARAGREWQGPERLPSEEEIRPVAIDEVWS